MVDEDKKRSGRSSSSKLSCEFCKSTVLNEKGRKESRKVSLFLSLISEGRHRETRGSRQAGSWKA